MRWFFRARSSGYRIADDFLSFLNYLTQMFPSSKTLGVDFVDRLGP